VPAPDDPPPQLAKSQGAQKRRRRAAFMKPVTNLLKMNSFVFIVNLVWKRDLIKPRRCRKATDFEAYENSNIRYLP
jgi:hypothetical protein